MATENPTVVLIHAAWLDESSWSDVVERLRQQSIEAVTVPLPMSSLNDDVAALDAALAAIGGPVVLVGHAYSGAVVSATHYGAVAALVYLTALTPDEGETVAQVLHHDEPDPAAPALSPDDEGWIRLPASAFETAFAQDATAEQQRRLAAAQRPINAAAISVPVGKPLWHSVPAWYLIAEHDRMIPAKTQRFLAERMNAHISAHPVGHVPSITAPELVTSVIADAVRAGAE